MEIALITGSNKGIGFETARQLGLQGKHILLAGRSLEKAQKAAAELQKAGVKAEALQLDITSEQQIRDAAEWVQKTYGKLDILINNAGVFPEYLQGMMDISRLSGEALAQTFQTNTLGPALMIRYFLPLLRQAAHGRIVNVSSTLGSHTNLSDPHSPFYGTQSVAYNASKAALNMLTIQVAKHLAGTQVRINSICPGWVRTDMGSEAAPRSVEEGVRIILKMSDTSADLPNGSFVDEQGVIAW
ncbi:MAG: SDR family oxidoreductase [Bacteroidetes bacterium]|jgi:NAD(P)-dependent dehydrogenase (short-subunit alcohol dehydrogenase family)|nr:SDR family oxidoreductase [Bacteroidota bacterium]